MPVYGSTEAEPIAHLNMKDITEDDCAAMTNGKGLLAGKPVVDIKLQIIKHQWGQPVGPFSSVEFIEQCQPTGEPGEIVVSGAHVLPGYLHGNGDKETKFQVDGIPWHRTGDEGYIDDDGRLWLLGRCIARINDERGIVYPFAVESAAMNHPAVKRAALILHHGDRVLVVESDGNKIDLKALKYALNNQLIEDILVVKQIPVDSRHNSKVDYPALMRMIENGGYKRC
jgi:acyl-CoA synthetase (AMP-forming)/AMP-acid ligase II